MIISLLILQAQRRANRLTEKVHTPSNLVVKSQVADIIDLILQLIGHPNGVHRPCRNRKSRGAVLSTSEGQWATTKFDGVWYFLWQRPCESAETLRLTTLHRE